MAHAAHSAQRWMKGLALGAAAVVAMAGVALAAAYGLAQSETGRAWIAERLAAALSTPGETVITIEELEPGLPGRIRVAGIAAADGAGPWLTADRLEIDWRPWALMSGTLRITDLRIPTLRIARAPRSTGEPDTGEPAGLPGLPVDVKVERLSIESIALDPDVLGEAAAFRVTGEAGSREAGHLATTLQIDRIDGATGGARIDALFDPGAQGLELDVAVNESAGGLIARALDSPDLPALNVFLTGEGPLTDWHGDLAVTLEDLASVKADVSLSRDDGVRFRIAGRAASTRPARDLPWSLVSGDTSFAADGMWSDENILTLAPATLESDAIALRVDGRLALANLELDARIGARIKDPAVLAAIMPEMRTEGLAVDVQAKGPLRAPKLDVSLTADRLALPDWDGRGVQARLTIAPDGALQRPDARAAVSFTGTVAELIAADLADVEPLLGRQYTWDVAGDVDVATLALNAARISLRAGPTEVTGRADVQLSTGAGEADLQIAIGDLSGLSPLLAMAIEGRAAIETHLTVSESDGAVTAALTGDLTELSVDEDIADALLAGRARIAGEVMVPGGGRLNLRNVAVETPVSTLTGQADFSGRYRQLEATYDLRVPDAGVLSQPLGTAVAGQATITGTAQGLASNPMLTGQIGMDAARIEGFDLGRLDATVRAEDLSGGPRGSVTFTATAPVKDAAGRTDFAIVDRTVHLSNLRLQGQGSTLTGDMHIPFTGLPLTGTAAIDTKNAAPWLAMIGVDGGGAVNATVKLTANGARQAADVDGTITAPVWRYADTGAAAADRIAITGRMDDVIDGRAGRIAIEAAGVALADVQLATLTAEISGDPNSATVRLDAKGTWHGPLTLQADGRIAVDQNGWAVNVANATGRVLDQPLAVQAPVKISVQDGSLTLDQLAVAFGTARLQADAHVDAERVNVKARLDALALDTLAPIWPGAPMSGVADASVSVAGPRDNPAGTGRLQISGLTLEAGIEAPPVGLDLTADWKDRRLSLGGRITGTPERDADLAADLPLRLAPNSVIPDLPSDEKISGRAVWTGQMASLWPLVPVDGHMLTGETKMDLRLEGSLAAPRVTGQVTLANGTYESIDSGTLLKDVQMRLDLADERIVLTDLQAGDGAAGRLTGSGEMTLDPSRNFPFSLTARATNLAAVRRDDVTAVASGEAEITGDLDKSSLRAAMTTETVEVRIIDRLPAEVVVLDVVETGAEGKIAETQTAATSNGAGPTVALDANLSMPRRVFVRGRGLDSEWAGAATIGGTADAPVIEGELRLVRGQMTVLTKVFRLTEGTVRFPGGSEVIPTLDVAADHNAGDLTVTARISGPATNPSVDLSSSPPLPRDEIVARVLFGKDTTQLSALEAAQLAAAVAELTGSGTGTGQVLDFARTLLGVDVLRLETAADTGAPGVEAGKYVRDDVYLSVKKGVTDESGAVGVEIELTPNISVESETDTTGQSDIGIKFKWDY